MSVPSDFEAKTNEIITVHAKGDKNFTCVPAKKKNRRIKSACTLMIFNNLYDQKLDVFVQELSKLFEIILLIRIVTILILLLGIMVR